MLLVSVSCLTGIFFGLNYKFVVLVPLTLATALAYTVSAVIQGQATLAIVYGIVILAVGLQGGYMIGLTSRELLSQIVSRFTALPSK